MRLAVVLDDMVTVFRNRYRAGSVYANGPFKDWCSRCCDVRWNCCCLLFVTVYISLSYTVTWMYFFASRVVSNSKTCLELIECW